MNILTIDTVLDKTYISFSINGKEIFKTIKSDERNYHSAYLIKTLDDILKENKIELKETDYIGTNTGTGSFTGIRAGLSIVKTISNRLDIKVVPMNTVEILSRYYKNKNIMLDARRGSVFYSKDGENIELISYEEALKIIDKSNSNFICDNSLLERFVEKQDKLISFEKEDIDLSQTELMITKEKIQKGIFVNSDEIKPTYIQTPPVFSK